MKLMQTLVAATLAASTLPALALTLDFEGTTSFDPIGTFYAGQGVTFSDSALALRNDELGPYFSNEPSPVPGTVMFGFDTAAVMNTTFAFRALSFSYSSDIGVDVKLYSGVDGTGDFLGSISIAPNAAGCAADSPKCKWDTSSFDFGGGAHSAVFSAGALYDNVTVAVPEPSTYAMALLGLAGVGLMARRRKA